jgi:hypothetical protein
MAAASMRRCLFPISRNPASSFRRGFEGVIDLGVARIREGEEEGGGGHDLMPDRQEPHYETSSSIQAF